MPHPTASPLLNRFGPLGRVGGNARTMLALEPFFGIPFGLVFAYATLYREALGLTPWQIGFVGTAGSTSMIIFSIFAGHITNRFGRRNSLLLADMVGWVVSSIIWVFASSFWHFVIAAVFNGFISISATAFNCLLIEDSRPDERVSIFRALQVIGLLSGFLSPVAGLLVARYGLIPATRGLYIFFLTCIAAMSVLRRILTRETGVGEKQMKATEKHTVVDGLKEYIKAAVKLGTNRFATMLVITNAVLAMRDALSTTFTTIYMNGELGIPAEHIAIFPTVGSGVQLAVLAVSLCIPARLPEMKSLTVGIFISGLGLGLLMFTPIKGYIPMTASWMLNAAGVALIVPAISSLWNNSIPDNDRANLTALMMVMSSVARAPGAWISGILYGLNPKFPFISAIVISGLALILVSQTAGRTPNANESVQ